MISRYEAYMDGAALSNIHPALLIMDISHTAANFIRQTQGFAKRNGLAILNSQQEATSVDIMFALRIYDIRERQQVLQKVQQWAMGKVLETNDREGQRLNVVCDEFPMIQSVMGWTDVLTMRFTAYEKPFWENKTPAVLSMTGSEAEGTLFVPGNAGTAFAEVTVEPSQAIDELTITVDDTTIRLIDLDTDETIHIGYDAMGNQYIKAGEDSILAKRTPDSSDDLLAICGKKNAVSVEADESVLTTVKVRGLWL